PPPPHNTPHSATGAPEPATGIDVIEVNDVPVSFHPHHRAHTGRLLHRTVEPLPHHLAGPPHTLIQRLIDYAHGQENA
ncbi:type I-E CRISPR-associated protein Cas5/CasD, partial [Streptomyces solincola]